MLTKQTSQLADRLVARGVSATEDKDVLAYGLSLALELGVNIVTSVFLAFLFGLAIESFIFLGAFAFLRSYAGGFHCKTTRNCYLGSNAVVAGVLALVRCTPVQYIPWMIVMLLMWALPTLWLLAPIGTPTKVLDELEYIYYRKKTRIHLLILVAGLLVLFIGGAHECAFVIGLGIGVSAGVVLVEELRQNWIHLMTHRPWRGV